MKALTAVRDERAAPMLGYILAHVDHKGPLGPLYLSAIETLGALKDPPGVTGLTEALYRGEWWAPRRTAHLRGAAAAALARIGTRGAPWKRSKSALASGPRGVRSAVRSHVAESPARNGIQRSRRDDGVTRASSPTNCCAASPRRCGRRSSIRRAIRSSPRISGR